MVNGIIEIIATNPPSIALAGGILLMLSGNEDLGMTVFGLGVVMQGAWLVLKFGLFNR